MQDNISYYSMGDVLDTAEFARRGRKRGSRDKGPRKKRMMLGAGALGGATLGYGGRIGIAGIREMRTSGMGRMAGLRAGARGAKNAATKDVGAVKMGASKVSRGINSRSRKAIGTVGNRARSVGGMLKGRKGLALAGAGAIAASAGGIYGMARRRRR